MGKSTLNCHVEYLCEITRGYFPLQCGNAEGHLSCRYFQLALLHLLGLAFRNIKTTPTWPRSMVEYFREFPSFPHFLQSKTIRWLGNSVGIAPNGSPFHRESQPQDSKTRHFGRRASSHFCRPSVVISVSSQQVSDCTGWMMWSLGISLRRI